MQKDHRQEHGDQKQQGRYGLARKPPVCMNRDRDEKVWPEIWFKELALSEGNTSKGNIRRTHLGPWLPFRLCMVCVWGGCFRPKYLNYQTSDILNARPATVGSVLDDILLWDTMHLEGSRYTWPPPIKPYAPGMASSPPGHHPWVAIHTELVDHILDFNPGVNLLLGWGGIPGLYPWDIIHLS